MPLNPGAAIGPEVPRHLRVHAAGIDKLVQHLLCHIKQRMTPQRMIVLHAITVTPHGDARRILEAAQRVDPAIGIATVYRTLRLLEDAGLIRACPLSGQAIHYELMAGRPHHGHIVDLDTGQVHEIGAATFEPGLRAVLAAMGWEPTRCELVVHAHRLPAAGPTLPAAAAPA